MVMVGGHGKSKSGGQREEGEEFMGGGSPLSLDFNYPNFAKHCKRCDRQVDRNSDVLAVVRKNFHDYPQFYPFAANLRSNDVTK